MNDDQLQQLMKSLSAAVLEGKGDPTGVVAVLITETVKFRDKLKEDTGEVFTVGDTRAALDALEAHFRNRPLPDDLTGEQRALVQIWIDRLTTFKS